MTLLIWIAVVLGILWLIGALLSNQDVQEGCGAIIGIIVGGFLLLAVITWLSGIGQNVRTWWSSRTTTAHAMLTQASISSDDRPDTATQTASMRTVHLSGIIDNKDTERSIAQVRLALKLHYCPVGLRQPTPACTDAKGDFDQSISGFLPLANKTDDPTGMAEPSPSDIPPGERRRFNTSFKVSDVPQGFFVMGSVALDRACTKVEADRCDK